MRVNLLFPDRPGDTSTGFRCGAQVADDLGLEILVGAMANGDPFLADVARATIAAGTLEPDVVHHRQAVLADCLAHRDIVEAIYAVTVEALQSRRYGWGLLSHRPSAVLSGAVETLAYFLPLLARLRQIAAANTATFSSEGLTRLMAELEQELDQEYLAELAEHLDRLRLRSGLLLEQALGEGVAGTGPRLLRQPDGSRWWRRLGVGGPPAYHFSLHPRDEAGARQLSEIRDRGVQHVAHALAQSMDHVREFFELLRSELGFFLGGANLYRRLEQRGVPVCWPRCVRSSDVASNRSALRAHGLYDVCLALSTAQPIVGNDVDATEHPLVLITGANSGGKSTFLRAMGVAQLMMQAGLCVGAVDFCSSAATGLFTHFLREEDESLEHGKLDEELDRMSVIADHLTDGCHLLSNESFASTNEREGSEIARQCFVAFVEAGVRVIGVTHQFASADWFRQNGRGDVCFLRAERGADGQAPYSLVPGEPLPTSFGEDLYLRIFGPDATTNGARLSPGQRSG